MDTLSRNTLIIISSSISIISCARRSAFCSCFHSCTRNGEFAWVTLFRLGDGIPFFEKDPRRKIRFLKIGTSNFFKVRKNPG